MPDPGIFTTIGVDDWAHKKRTRYGSILVDLTTRRVVDLLPNRGEGSLIAWLHKQPAIEIITRDRYSKYRRAATVGAPQTLQVTDRWHLLKNLGEAFTNGPVEGNVNKLKTIKRQMYGRASLDLLRKRLVLVPT